METKNVQIKFEQTNFEHRGEPIYEAARRVLKIIRNHPLIEGETWYLVEYHWYGLFENEIWNCHSEKIGSMDNSSLVSEENNSILKLGALESEHFEVVPGIVCNYISKTYGCKIEIPRNSKRSIFT
ncbi:hypothetical protein DFA_04066 [Cavenderia fasciculata]|uniref:DUSP domain-containing protein n=1 Tax=Cavenderia fasciculata TaxID=261658 RepID=F4Q171_CACFS|nr:uncharacterized protein DFA_04066 [Cavenderia fasciculata]EGG18572.1 hypothetical protein DFA_04066 [Cavenderia fasciculata]|eukprot:XP_004366476.1 hypothetical protein DFA_04066 [Cavenderia fasciculata]